MNTLKKLICAMLIFGLLLPVTPIQALELEKLPEFGREYAVFADPMNPDQPVPAPQWPQTASPLFTGTDSYLTDPAEAGAILRSAMKARQSQVTVKIQASADTEFKALTAEILAAALAHTGNPTEGDYLARQRGMIQSSATVYAIGGVNYYETTFHLEYYTTAAQEAEMDTAVAALLAILDLEGKSDYEKVSKVYRWMCENIKYDNDNLYDDSYTLKYTGYAALINHTAVCQGYAVLLYRLCLEMGIDCRIITGDGNGGGHAWNIVKLGGKYYNLDATWDASYYMVRGEYNYFLRTDDTFGDHTRDVEFTTDEFHAAYPMGTEDYDPDAQPQRTAGDINGDGTLDNKDLTRLFQYLSDWDVEVSADTLDINGDGSVNNKDLTRLFQYLSGWDVEIH